MSDTLLIIEDDYALRTFLADNLTADGYELLVAATAADGRRALEDGAPAVAIVDVELPDESGLHLIARVREADPRFARIDPAQRFLVLSGRGSELDRVRGLQQGADDYLAKPFSYPVLLAHLRALTRRGLGIRPAVLVAGPITLDSASRTVARDGAPVDLTTREFAILEHLLRRKGHVVSKTELLEHCWDPAYEGAPAVVEVQVHRLRRKIEDTSGTPLIETLRGEGYLIRDDRP
jgi:two-component system OmpR family response regulator